MLYSFKKKLMKTLFIGLIFTIIILIFFSYEESTSTHYKKSINQDYMITGDNLIRTIFDLQAIGDRTSWLGQHKTSKYIQNRLLEIGLVPSRHVYSFNGMEWENISIELKGKENNNSKIIIMAHYDSTSKGMSNYSPGADDNGSGVAVLLEFANVLKNQFFNTDIQLVFFSNEENGREGSKSFASQLRAKGIQTKGILNIDIVGYNNSTALFSREIIDVSFGEYPFKKKIKMLMKMMYNFGMLLLENKKELKIIARTEDNHLIPNEKNSQVNESNRFIKWKIGDACA